MMKKLLSCLSVVVVALSLCFLCACGSSDTTSSEESHIYDDAEVIDVMSGSGTNKIGEYSLIKVPEAEVTDEALVDWYLNYIVPNDFNWCVILYSDNEPMGVYGNKGSIEKDVKFDYDGTQYYLGSDDASDLATMYSITDDGELIPW